MFYEEKMIGGVMHWRGTPDGEWRPMTVTQLTEALEVARRKLAIAREELSACDAYREALGRAC